MLAHIENEFLQVTISDAGAELMSIRSADGTEYLWQGDAAYWSDRAPNIFPYVARLTDGCYTYQGKTYHLPIHGFAPTAKFSVRDWEKTTVTFTLENLTYAPTSYKVDSETNITFYGTPKLLYQAYIDGDTATSNVTYDQHSPK